MEINGKVRKNHRASCDPQLGGLQEGYEFDSFKGLDTVTKGNSRNWMWMVFQGSGSLIFKGFLDSKSVCLDGRFF